MNKKELYKRIQELKKTGLSNAEKSSMLSAVTGAPAPSPYVRRTWRIFSRVSFYAYVTGLAAFVLFGGGSLIYASEKAVPGDLLYAVKTKVVEPVRDALVRTPEAKADWEARKAERRLEEAETLASERKLDQGKRAELETKFGEHARGFSEAVSQLSSSSSTEGEAKKAKEKFETSVDAHDKVLDGIEKQTPESERVEIKNFRASVHEKVKDKKENKGKEERLKDPEDRNSQEKDDASHKEGQELRIRLEDR